MSEATSQADANGKKRIVLVAMDGSHHSHAAFQWYVKHIHLTDSYIVITYCAEFRSASGSPVTLMSSDPALVSKMIEEEEAHIQLYISKLNKELTDSGISGKVIRISGNPGHAIVKAAEAEGANMIVTGSRGLGTIRRTFMGSVSDYVLHHSHVPVLVCRQQVI